MFASVSSSKSTGARTVSRVSGDIVALVLWDLCVFVADGCDMDTLARGHVNVFWETYVTFP